MTTSDIVPNEGGAVFSQDRQYRYRLWRHLQYPEQGTLTEARDETLTFIMLNPSTADAEQDDPTVRRCIGYATDWGYRELIVGNIFAYRATDPDDLYDHANPVGPHNDDHLHDIALDADRVVAAWGHHGEHLGRGRAVATSLAEQGHDLHALGTTQDGHPRHPLYLDGDAEPEPFSYEDDR